MQDIPDEIKKGNKCHKCYAPIDNKNLGVLRVCRDCKLKTLKSAPRY